MWRNSHQFLLPVSMVAVPIRDLILFDMFNPSARNRTAANILREVSGHRTTVNICFLNPGVPAHASEAVEQRDALRHAQTPRHDKLSRTNGSHQVIDQLATKHDLQYSPSHKDGFLRFHKTARSIHAARRNETVHMGVDAEVASPRVQHGNDARLCSQVIGVGQKRFDGASSRLHLQVGEYRSIELPKDVQLFRNGEDQVSVFTGQQLRPDSLQPLGPLSPLTLPARSMSARVVFDVANVLAAATLQRRSKATCATVDDTQGGFVSRLLASDDDGSTQDRTAQ